MRVGDVFTQLADPARELHGALGRLATPEGHGRGLAVRIFDVHAARGFDGGDAPGSVAKLDDIADAGVDGEVFIKGGDLMAVGLQDDGDDGGVRDGAAVRRQ